MLPTQWFSSFPWPEKPTSFNLHGLHQAGPKRALVPVQTFELGQAMLSHSPRCSTCNVFSQLLNRPREKKSRYQNRALCCLSECHGFTTHAQAASLLLGKKEKSAFQSSPPSDRKEFPKVFAYQEIQILSARQQNVPGHPNGEAGSRAFHRKPLTEQKPSQAGSLLRLAGSQPSKPPGLK